MALLLLAAASLGCAQHEVWPTTAHMPTKPEDVKVYQKHPAKYEQLEQVSVEITPDLMWNERGEAPKAIDALRAKAAALGANGLLLAQDATDAKLVVLATYHGEHYQIPMKNNPRTAVARAIYVIEEQKGD
jgi:hypothetical protein